MVIINTVNQLLGSYLQGEIGDVLDKVDLSLKFLDNETVAATKHATGATKSESSTVTRPGVGAHRQLLESTTLLLEVSGSIDIESSKTNDTLAFTKERVTTIFKEFFEGVPRDRLYDQLRSKDITVDTIIIIDADADSIENNHNPANTSAGDDGGSNTALIAGLVGGGVALVALMTALFIRSHRKQSKTGVHDELGSASDHETKSGEQRSTFARETLTNRVSFPSLLDDESSQDGANSLSALKGTKKKKKKKKTKSSASWASGASGGNRRSVKNKHLAPISTRDPYYGEDEDVFLSPVEL